MRTFEADKKILQGGMRLTKNTAECYEADNSDRDGMPLF